MLCGHSDLPGSHAGIRERSRLTPDNCLPRPSRLGQLSPEQLLPFRPFCPVWRTQESGAVSAPCRRPLGGDGEGANKHLLLVGVGVWARSCVALRSRNACRYPLPLVAKGQRVGFCLSYSSIGQDLRTRKAAPG